MVENGHSRKSKKQKYVERCDEIAGAIESYINERHITTGQYEAQAVHMKTIEVTFCFHKFQLVQIESMCV